MLYQAGVRINAGPVEQYLIRISVTRLERSGVRIPFVTAGAGDEQVIVRLEARRGDDYPLALGPRLPTV